MQRSCWKVSFVLLLQVKPILVVSVPQPIYVSLSLVLPVTSPCHTARIYHVLDCGGKLHSTIMEVGWDNIWLIYGRRKGQVLGKSYRIQKAQI